VFTPPQCLISTASGLTRVDRSGGAPCESRADSEDSTAVARVRDAVILPTTTNSVPPCRQSSRPALREAGEKICYATACLGIEDSAFLLRCSTVERSRHCRMRARSC
jgi:hypothetical protein